MSSSDGQLTQLQTAIAAQEVLRPTLGDAVVDVTLAALRRQLDALYGQQQDPARPRCDLLPKR